jgi:2-C-methyl-D-erythritol 4-phosphate cytidylyltransferase
MTETIIITAGGIGKRMESNIPKQFIELNGIPILMHTINQFYDYNNAIQIVVVLPEDHIDFWNELIKTHNFIIDHQIIKGGKERFHSIKNGLSLAKGQLIGVHDAVRPFVNVNVIKNCFDALKKHQAVVPVVDLKESIRQVDGDSSKSVDRNQFKIVQTPQCFVRNVILTAYNQPYSNLFTDDASVVEQLNIPIHLIEGNEGNIKITTPVDLAIANLFLNK